jgi:hypothetical protein
MVACSQTAMALEEPAYSVIASTGNYEVRRYEPYLVAEVDVDGNFGSAGNDAFRMLAGYIFGDNVPEQKMAMTAPVESTAGTKMAMTAPVTSRSAGDTNRYTYAFVMERKYTLDTLPKPTNPEVRIVPREGRVMAVRRYSGTWSENRYRDNEDQLLAALNDNSIDVIGDPVFARYNAPFTPWFMRRNEVMVEIDWSDSD